ncbi:hypothetical protein COY62_02480 [bacterium (Candidatus Howlettbacteria) CG_4_10_14_0_8_um_filter_40_9]|nr:MAG: hypothetical protein COY62_02480 [bacterium (Candidatus Howlettbacteria) CG_4_10_14_0_8_um_filter_40_9]
METLKKTSLFWDVELKTLDAEKHKKFIIERILLFGNVEDFRWARDFYGEKCIKDVVISNRTLDRKSQNFWCQYFNINQKLCIRNQSTKRQSLFWKR